MGTERIPGKLDHRDGDVGAVIRDALTVRDDVVEHKALLDRADPLLKTLYVVELHLVAEFIHYLFQRLDTAGEGKIFLAEGRHRHADNLTDRGKEHIQLSMRVGGKGKPLFMQLPGALGQVQSVVGNTLKVGKRVEILAHFLVLLDRHLTPGDPDQIGAERIFIRVAVIFQLFHLRKALFAVVKDEGQGGEKGFLGDLGHVVDGELGLFDGKGRIGQEALLQLDDGGTVLLRTIGHQSGDKGLDHIGEGQ